MELQNKALPSEELHRAEETVLSPDWRQGWKRAADRGLDPDTARPYPVSAAQLAVIHRSAKPLLVHAQAIATAMNGGRWVQASSLCALMFNADGVLVKIYSSVSMRPWVRARGIRRWTRWSEEDLGPNIFSEGIGRNGVTMMKGEECFAKCLRDGVWYFHPMLRADDTVWGGLALVCPETERSPHLEYLVTALYAGTNINTHWFDMMERCTVGTEGMGFMIIDCSEGEHRLITMGDEIFRMLAIPKDDYYYEPVEHYIAPLPANAEFWRMVNGQLNTSDVVMQLLCRGKRVDVCISATRYFAPGIHTNTMELIFNSLGRIQQLASKQPGSPARFTFGSMVGKSAEFMDAIRRVENAARSESNILLQGESGTGKDVVAQAIHNSSSRRKGPFVAINCASFSKELIASELFGYEEGSFTGARKGGSIGKFEMANHGTLFLDEIGDMPLDVQAVLLRTLEERCFMKVGGTQMHHVNVRIVAATNKQLRERMRNGLFREDLFYRLGVVRITVPPLRQREEDVLLLSEHFIASICDRQNRAHCTLTSDARRFFLTYQWPGNVRELQNLLEGIISTCTDLVIDADTVIQYLGYEGVEVTTPPPAIFQFPAEKERMIQAMEAFHNNRCKAAEAMNMSRSTFYRRLKEYGLEE